MLYTVVLVFEMSSDSPSYQLLYSEEFFAIEASSDTEAKEKAIAKGKASEHSYKNREGETITVTFKTVVDVQEPLEAMPQNEGVIYVRHFRNYQAYELFEPMLKGESL
jgi:hypothetical protein